MIDLIYNWLNISQLEMSGWELVPTALLLLFLAGGCTHLLKARSTQNSEFKEKRRGTPRIRLNVPMIIDTPITQPFSVKSYDISVTGAFIPLFEMKESMNFTSLIGKRSGIKVGDVIGLKLQTGRFSHIQCQGKVVRIGQAGPQPEGLGIQFLQMSRRDQRKLEHLLSDQQIQKIV